MYSEILKHELGGGLGIGTCTQWVVQRESIDR